MGNPYRSCKLTPQPLGTGRAFCVSRTAGHGGGSFVSAGRFGGFANPPRGKSSEDAILPGANVNCEGQSTVRFGWLCGGFALALRWRSDSQIKLGRGVHQTS